MDIISADGKTKWTDRDPYEGKWQTIDNGTARCCFCGQPAVDIQFIEDSPLVFCERCNDIIKPLLVPRVDEDGFPW